MATYMMRCLLLALIPLAASAQIYKTVDANGNVVYTDNPPPDAGAEPVELQRTNTAPPPPPMVLPERSEPAPAKESTANVPQAFITAPANETTIPMGGGNFSVSATAKPKLQRGQGMVLTLDGAAVGGPQASGFWDLQNVIRGQHDLVVQVQAADGTVLSSSEPVRVYVLRPSVIAPN